ncbi:hypothetical protein FACS189465_2840 [Clostridia bacterium]|nr:hypothetical protein FACS189465_2840 [Clostridia bacterium]
MKIVENAKKFFSRFAILKFCLICIAIFGTIGCGTILKAWILIRGFKDNVQTRDGHKLWDIVLANSDQDHHGGEYGGKVNYGGGISAYEFLMLNGKVRCEVQLYVDAAYYINHISTAFPPGDPNTNCAGTELTHNPYTLPNTALYREVRACGCQILNVWREYDDWLDFDFKDTNDASGKALHTVEEKSVTIKQNTPEQAMKIYTDESCTTTITNTGYKEDVTKRNNAFLPFLLVDVPYDSNFGVESRQMHVFNDNKKDIQLYVKVLKEKYPNFDENKNIFNLTYSINGDNAKLILNSGRGNTDSRGPMTTKTGTLVLGDPIRLNYKDDFGDVCDIYEATIPDVFAPEFINRTVEITANFTSITFPTSEDNDLYKYLEVYEKAANIHDPNKPPLNKDKAVGMFIPNNPTNATKSTDFYVKIKRSSVHAVELYDFRLDKIKIESSTSDIDSYAVLRFEYFLVFHCL